MALDTDIQQWFKEGNIGYAYAQPNQQTGDKGNIFTIGHAGDLMAFFRALYKELFPDKKPTDFFTEYAGIFARLKAAEENQTYFPDLELKLGNEIFYLRGTVGKDNTKIRPIPVLDYSNKGDEDNYKQMRFKFMLALGEYDPEKVISHLKCAFDVAHVEMNMLCDGEILYDGKVHPNEQAASCPKIDPASPNFHMIMQSAYALGRRLVLVEEADLDRPPIQTNEGLELRKVYTLKILSELDDAHKDDGEAIARIRDNGEIVKVNASNGKPWEAGYQGAIDFVVDKFVEYRLQEAASRR